MNEDAPLVEAAQKDPRQFAALYRKYYEQIYRFCYYRLNRNRELTEDIVADTFIRALENIARYTDQGSPFVVWLYTIARHLIIDHYKSGKARLEGGSEPIDWAKSDQNPAEDAEEKDLIERVGVLIKCLTPEDQELVTLKFTSELSFKEVGTVLGIKEGAAKMRYCRLVEKLKNGMIVKPEANGKKN
jgi:RNA polymerase sigma-70 factor (ECF subfamily)